MSWGIAESIERYRRTRRRKCQGARTLRRSTTKRPSSWRRGGEQNRGSAKCWRLAPIVYSGLGGHLDRLKYLRTGVRGMSGRVGGG